MRIPSSIITAVLICVGVVPLWNDSLAQNVIFVNQAAVGADNGASWSDAYVFLQDALSIAQTGDEIWVATGIYQPDQGTNTTLGDRDATFNIQGGVSVYGGFTGTEVSQEERDWKLNETILSGDLLGDDDELLTIDNPLREDNSFHVVSMTSLYETGEIDGFSVNDGHGNVRRASLGAAIFVDSFVLTPNAGFLAIISNCLFEHNVSSGGTIWIGMLDREEPSALIQNSEVRHNWGVTSAGITSVVTAVIRNTIITENESLGAGAIFTNHVDVFIVGSTISNNVGNHQIDFSDSNRADKTLYLWDTLIAGNISKRETVGVREGNLLSVNNIFTGNTSDHIASTIQTTHGVAVIANNVFAFNKSLNSGSVIVTRDTNTIISNSIFWENESPEDLEINSWDPPADDVQISHSIVQQSLPLHVIDLGGLISGDPLFLGAAGPDNIPGTIDDDFRLSGFSPAIDAGYASILPPDQFDLDGDGILDERWPTDFLGNFRFFDGGSGTANVDIGAYEYGAPPIVLANDRKLDVPRKASTLISNYPNPFSVSTTLSYSISKPSEVTLELYDILGKRVRVLEHGFRAAGEHEVQVDGGDLSAGIYFLRLTAGKMSQSKKMVLLR